MLTSIKEEIKIYEETPELQEMEVWDYLFMDEKQFRDWQSGMMSEEYMELMGYCE